MGSAFSRGQAEVAPANTREGSRVTVVVDCSFKWSQIQDQTYKRVSSPGAANADGTRTQTVIVNNQKRAKRIAATYARIYLETEDVQGDRKKKGRYYWPALGAFAVKQVYCGFAFAEDGFLMKAAGAVPLMGAAEDNRLLLEGMSRGNFWLFQEIAPWHLFHSRWPDEFLECIEERDETKFHDTVRKNLKVFPWKAGESIGKLEHFRITKDLREGLKLIPEIEKAKREDKARQQLKSLIAIAKHEQNVVLQRLTYDDPDVQRILKKQSTFETLVPGMMERAVHFSAACELQEIEPNRYKKVRMGYDQKGEHAEPRDQLGIEPGQDFTTRFGVPIKEEKNLFDASQRWLFVSRVALAFHKLMQEENYYMEEQITAIASWKDA